MKIEDVLKNYELENNRIVGWKEPWPSEEDVQQVQVAVETLLSYGGPRLVASAPSAGAYWRVSLTLPSGRKKNG